MNSFMKELKAYSHILPKQTINTLKGQAINGDIEGARKGLNTALNKHLSNKDRMINAHRSTRYMTKVFDVNYKDQLSISLRK